MDCSLGQSERPL